MAISKVSVLGFILALMFLPALVMAQDSGLIPCGYGDNPCDTSDVANFVNGLISFLIQMLGIIAVIVMVYAGFMLVTSGGDEGQWTKAKSLFTNVVIGIVIILAAWLIVDTIMKTLTGDGLDVWGRLTGGEYGVETALVDNGARGVSAGQYTDSEARSALSAAGITVWESAPGRTQLGGMNQETISEAIRLRQTCNCSVIVTGGTESGHAGGTYSHGSGYKIDLDDTAALTSHIKNNYTRSGTRSGDGAILYTDPSRPGVEYALEGDHWDITVR
ncbi:TrbC/VirB2 family protein [Candidatus Nomurabacteria bacterium]|nr:TrbC/VirB2 family protein [Candidatus Nomurabacteria bacterium]